MNQFQMFLCVGSPVVPIVSIFLSNPKIYLKSLNSFQVLLSDPSFPRSPYSRCSFLYTNPRKEFWDIMSDIIHCDQLDPIRSEVHLAYFNYPQDGVFPESSTRESLWWPFQKVAIPFCGHQRMLILKMLRLLLTITPSHPTTHIHLFWCIGQAWILN